MTTTSGLRDVNQLNNQATLRGSAKKIQSSTPDPSWKVEAVQYGLARKGRPGSSEGQDGPCDTKGTWVNWMAANGTICPVRVQRLCDWPWSPDLSSSLMECPLKNSDKRDLNSIDLVDLRPLTFKNETSWSEKSACSVWKANLPGLSCGHLEV